MAIGGCSQQIIIELIGRGGQNINTEPIRQGINNNLNKSFEVETRQARFDADVEVVASTRGSIIMEQDVDTARRITMQQIRRQALAYEFNEWRVEAV